MLNKGDLLTVNGHGPLKVINAAWELSLNVKTLPHRLLVLFEGEKVFIRFVSNDKGEFVGLEKI